MKKVLLVTILLASVAFSYNTVLGNRGTFGVYSGACEDMGMLTINLNSYVAMINIDSILPGDSTVTSAQLTEILPYYGISFTPWHYLELALWGHGRYATFSSVSSTADELYSDLGLSVKGGVPIYFNERKKSYFAPGIDGFAYMQGVGTNVFGFGGRGLLTLRANWFGLHINGGYEYVTLVTPVQNVLAGAGIEVWPFQWGGIAVDGTARVPQTDLGNIANYLKVTPGLRFGFGGRVVKFNINLGMELEPMETPFRWHGLAGFGLGFDLMPSPAEFVNGIVVDKQTQEPIAGAKLSIKGHPDIEPYITDLDGRFSLDTPEGEYVLVAEHPDYIAIETNYELIELEGGTVMLEMPPAFGGAIVVGTVLDASDNSPVGAVVKFVGMDADPKLATFNSDPVSGYYRANVPAGIYRVSVEAPGYKSAHKSMLLREADEIVVDFKLEGQPAPEIPPPAVVSFKPVYFGRGQMGLYGNDYMALMEAVEIMKANPGVNIELHGHTDSVGDADSNYHLSIQRAQSVRDFLVNGGIAPGRIKVVGHGESRPRGDNRTRSGRDINRRVDLVAVHS